MTTEIEKQFFETFGIEPKWKDARSINTKIYTDVEAKEIRAMGNRNIQLCYPEITAEMLLELICILTVINNVYKVPKIRTPDDLKYWILEICIKEEECIRTRVRKLFEEDE